MNPFAEDEDASIPLKARNYSNFTDSDDTHMDEDDKPDAQPNDDDYGTFNGSDSNRPSIQPLMKGSSIQIKKSPILRPQSPNRMNTPIRTDRVTGNRYLRLRSVPIDDDAPGAVLNYEKEVYNSMVYDYVPWKVVILIYFRSLCPYISLFDNIPISDGVVVSHQITMDTIPHDITIIISESISLPLSLSVVDIIRMIQWVISLHCWYGQNMFHIAPRNESLHNIWLDHQSQMRQRNMQHFDARSVGSSVSMKSMQNTRAARFKNKDVSEEVLHGYAWLGKSSPWRDHLNKVRLWHNEAIALVLLALMVTVVAFIISQMTNFCWGVIDYVYKNKVYNKILIFLGCLVLKCGFVFAAIFFTITTPQTAGSGIPELKVCYFAMDSIRFIFGIFPNFGLSEMYCFMLIPNTFLFVHNLSICILEHNFDCRFFLEIHWNL